MQDTSLGADETRYANDASRSRKEFENVHAKTACRLDPICTNCKKPKTACRHARTSCRFIKTADEENQKKLQRKRRSEFDITEKQVLLSGGRLRPRSATEGRGG